MTDSTDERRAGKVVRSGHGASQGRSAGLEFSGKTVRSVTVLDGVSVLGSVGVRSDDEGMPDTGPDHLDLSDLDLGGIDPDNVYVLHSHNNPQTGATAFSSSWPCPQCIALGRTEPLKYGRDVPNYPTVTSAEVPPERLEAYLA